MKGGPHEPTAPVKPIVRGRGDTPPPAPPQELSRGAGEPREFGHGGRRWIARLSGKGATGTGSYGLGLIDAVHFFDAEQPARPLREALLPHGRFESLFDEELAALLDAATPIVLPK
jgi:hypothetical protein